MKVREILRYEIWSKETSRKILLPVGRFLKRAAIVFGVLVFLIVVVYAIESSWLTNGERTAGRAALAKIEYLEKLVDSNNGQFVIADANAKAAIRVAEQRAWTLRDHAVANSLSFYLIEVEAAQEQVVREAELKRLMQQRKLRWRPDPKLAREDASWRSQEFSTFRSVLQKELN